MPGAVVTLAPILAEIFRDHTGAFPPDGVIARSRELTRVGAVPRPVKIPTTSTTRARAADLPKLLRIGALSFATQVTPPGTGGGSEASLESRTADASR